MTRAQVPAAGDPAAASGAAGEPPELAAGETLTVRRTGLRCGTCGKPAKAAGKTGPRRRVPAATGGPRGPEGPAGGTVSSADLTGQLDAPARLRETVTA